MCIGTEIVPPQWTATDILIGERTVSGERARLVCGAALVSQDKSFLCEEEAEVAITQRWEFVCHSIDTNAQQE